MKDNIIVKRLCIFFVGLVIGLIAGHNHGVVETKERFQDRIMKKAENPVQRNRIPEPRGKTFFEKKKRVRQ